MNETLYEFKVNDRQTFIRFLELLQKDFLNNPENWENKTLPDFLEALRAYTEDIQGYYDNMKLNVNADKPDWSTFADIFKGAKIMSNRKIPTYILRFFFDYNCGGCLWCGNEAAYEKYDVGTLDAELYDLNGNVSQEARIKLPDSTKKKVLALDKLYSESLNWENPAGDSMWDKFQWDNFHSQTRELHKEISNILGDDFEIIYEQE